MYNIIKEYDESQLKIWDDFVFNQSLNGTIYHSRVFFELS